MRILMIIDDLLIQEFFPYVLTKAGHKVNTARNGHEGLILFRQASTDLVITDLIMPVKDGITAIQELRREYPHVKIIAISAAAHASFLLATAKAAGAQYPLAKPVLPRTLLATVPAVFVQSSGRGILSVDPSV